MKQRILKLLDVEPEESGSVFLLLAISFMLGMFLATVTVASQTLFLTHFSETFDLPRALVISGVLGLIVTAIYNFLQVRIPFTVLAIGSLTVVLILTAFIEFGENLVADDNLLYYYGFTLILPFTFISMLVFWGAFERMYNLRQSKRIIGSVDLGTMVAQILAFFTIPILLELGIPIAALFTVGLFSIAGYLLLFIVLSNRYLKKGMAVTDEAEHEKITVSQFFKNKYIIWMSLFIIVSLVALRFIDYSFFNVSTQKFDTQRLPYFLSLFEATIVIFSFFFTTFGTDRILQDYGLRVSLLVTPVLLIIFTVGAFGLGIAFGSDVGLEGNVVFFFIMVAMSKLFINALRDAIDSPVFKFYFVPIDKAIKLDAQTKLEGFITALGSTIAGGLIVLINQFKIFNLLSITMFTIPVLVIWYLVTNKMYHGYRTTLQNSLVKNKSSVDKDHVREYTMDSVLEKEVRSTAEEKAIYGLRLMEKLEPALFESSILTLAESKIKKVKQFALDKIQQLGLNPESEIQGLAKRAAGELEDSDLLSISPEKLMKLSKSVKQTDRLLAAKLLRKLISPKTIFILLEMMRDADPKVRSEALLTARKVKRPETWNVLIELLGSPSYSHAAAAALKETGEQGLQYLETSFHKSGQSDLVMLKIVSIIGHIGGKEGMELLWKKADYPDKRIVKQILYSLRYIDYKAKGREVLAVKDLLDVEMSKTLWNLAALDELHEDEHFEFLKEALKEEIRDNYDHLSLLLSLLYDSESVQLVKENIETGSPDSIAYALELLDLFVDQDLKPKLIPLLDESKIEDKLEKLQTYFPRESYNPVQVINYILNRDFNYNNRWTKLCAVHASAYIKDFRVSRGLISQMFNQDKLLQETAAWVIYNKDKKIYPIISERLPLKDKKFLDSAIENNQLLDGLDDGFFLGFEMVLFIKQLPVFKGISGNLVSDLADKIIPVTLKLKDKLVLNEEEDNQPILILAHGSAKMKNGTEELGILKQGDVHGDLFQEGHSQRITEIEALERTVIFKINLIDFYFVLANHHDLVQGLIKNVTGNRVKQTV
ncbi:MAG: HEAT repeat domain-containing protein [Bacteroidia bacterium]|nr:HEAT repeat domain-containing protein [Bacteroidia bacterium]